ncbi:septum formation protein Maf [Candidatus Micrarchaeota archaeon]|nr:septum formation protein Maf [Candidatus Micrarchaeota archaeon]
MRIILASQSAFRKRALDILGLKYETTPSSIDEKAIRDSDPMALARKLSEAKAKAVGEKNPDSIVIASDLLVTLGNKVYEKPENEEDAFRMLRSYSGKEVSVITGLAIYNSATMKLLSTAVKDTAKFRSLTDSEIRDYMARYPVLKCAGAFEGDGLLRFSESFSGKLAFLTALPINELVLFLRENGVNV